MSMSFKSGYQGVANGFNVSSATVVEGTQQTLGGGGGGGGGASATGFYSQLRNFSGYSLSPIWPQLTAIKQAPDGKYYMAGYANYNNEGGWIAQFDEDGTFSWIRKIGNGYLRLYDLIFDGNDPIVMGADAYYYNDNWWIHAWGNYLPYHYGHDQYSYHNGAAYEQHKDDKKKPHEFEFMDPMWMTWSDYDFGAIFGIKLKDNLGVFAEGQYLYYWGRPAYDIKLGVNYQFMGF